MNGKAENMGDVMNLEVNGPKFCLSLQFSLGYKVSDSKEREKVASTEEYSAVAMSEGEESESVGLRKIFEIQHSARCYICVADIIN